MNGTLLDLDHIPTLDELCAFFHENDFSAASYLEMNYDKLDGDTVEALEHIKGLMDARWEPLAREMGLKSDSAYYGKDNPLIALRDNTENLAAGGVLKLLEEQPEKAAEILEQFDFGDPDIKAHVDDLLHNAVETVMRVMGYEEIAKVVQATPAYEDFNHRKELNYRAKDFDRRWNHTRAQTQVESLDALQDTTNVMGESVEFSLPDLRTDIFEEVAAKLTQENFWTNLTDDDRALLKLRMEGLSQAEIAQRLGYQTHSAVTKRLQKLKALFEQCA